MLMLLKLFKNHSSKPRHSDAIPDGGLVGFAASPQAVCLIPVSKLIGIELPPFPIVHALLDSYLRSCHWYITLFHEPTFRAQLKPILESGSAQQVQKPFLMFLITVLLNGARFSNSATFARINPNFDINGLQSTFMSVIEQNFLSSFEPISLHSLGYLFLLSTIYLARQKTQMSFAVLGMAIRAAQAIGLHKEALWGQIDPIERHIRRTIWWSLYMADG
jgi:Fungal specific transcription factor domain